MTPTPDDLRVQTVDSFLASTSVQRHTWLSVSTQKQLRQCWLHHKQLGSSQTGLPAGQEPALFVLLPAKLTHSINPASCQLRLFHRFPPGTKPYIDGQATVLPPIQSPLELWTSFRPPAQVGSICMAADPSMLFDTKVCGERAVALLDSGATRSFISPRGVIPTGTPCCELALHH